MLLHAWCLCRFFHMKRLFDDIYRNKKYKYIQIYILKNSQLEKKGLSMQETLSWAGIEVRKQPRKKSP